MPGRFRFDRDGDNFDRMCLTALYATTDWRPPPDDRDGAFRHWLGVEVWKLIRRIDESGVYDRLDPDQWRVLAAGVAVVLGTVASTGVARQRRREADDGDASASASSGDRA